MQAASSKVFTPYSIPEAPPALDPLPEIEEKQEALQQAEILLTWHGKNIAKVESLELAHENLKVIAEKLLALFNLYSASINPLNGATVLPRSPVFAKSQDTFDQRVMELNELARHYKAQWGLVSQAHKHLEQVQKKLRDHSVRLQAAHASSRIESIEKVEEVAYAVLAASYQLKVSLDQRVDGILFGGRTSITEKAIAALQASVWAHTRPTARLTGPIYRTEPAKPASVETAAATAAKAAPAFNSALIDQDIILSIALIALKDKDMEDLKAFQKIILRLVERDGFEQVLLMLKMITDPELQIPLIKGIFPALCEKGEIEQVISVVEMITNPEVQAEAFTEFVSFLLEEGKIEQAYQIAERMSEKEWKPETCLNLLQKARSLPDSEEKAAFLAKLAAPSV